MLVHVLIIVFTIMQSMHIFSHVIIMDVMILLTNRNMLLKLFEHLCGGRKTLGGEELTPPYGF